MRTWLGGRDLAAAFFGAMPYSSAPAFRWEAAWLLAREDPDPGRWADAFLEVRRVVEAGG
jgi:hypothetical protein